MDLRKRVDRESKNLSQLLQLQGAVDLVLCASRSHERPQLRSEEAALQRERRREKEKDGERKSGAEDGLILDKILAG